MKICIKTEDLVSLKAMERLPGIMHLQHYSTCVRLSWQQPLWPV